MYKIDMDVGRKVFWITGQGFWSAKTIATFSVDILARFSAARLRHGQFAVLVDVRAMPIQNGEVMDGIMALMAKGLRLTSAPITMVTGTMLGKMQADRVMSAPNCRTFTDMDEALAWLVERWPSAAGGRCPSIGMLEEAA